MTSPPKYNWVCTQSLDKRWKSIELQYNEMCTIFVISGMKDIVGQILPVEPQWEYNPWEQWHG